MSRRTFTLDLRRLASLSLLGVLGAAILAPAGAVAADTTVGPATITAEEAHMVGLLNQDRAAIGLVAVRVDNRLMAVARARSADMVARSYFGHTQPDGRNVFDILTARRITWYNAGEIIATNNFPIDLSASSANHQWLNSSSHRAIVLSKGFNYVGVGLAVDPATGKKLWTAVYLKGPDRTGARARVAAPAVVAGTTATTRKVSVAWSGSDVPLQVLTSGLYSFRVQRSVDGGGWTTMWASTTSRSLTLDLANSHTYQFRIAARDRAGNWGTWVTTTADLSPPVGRVVLAR